jgi:pentatricopeptide repeat protein
LSIVASDEDGQYPNTASNKTAIQAEELLNEMEEQCRKDPKRQLKLDAKSYALAIRACLQVNDTVRAEALLHRMELSDTPPDTITYNMILNHWSKMVGTDHAKKASQILQYMITTSKQQERELQQQAQQQQASQSNGSSNSNHNTSNSTIRGSDIKPDLYSYSRVIAAWARSDDPDASNQIWKLYQWMIYDKQLVLNMVCYNKILAFFAKTNHVTDLYRAVQVLQAMEHQTSSTSLSATTSQDNKEDDVDRNNAAIAPSNPSPVQPDFSHYHSIISRAIEIGHVEVAVQLVRQYIESFLYGRVKKPKGVVYRMIVREYIRYGDLMAATNFLLDLKEIMETHRKAIGLDISTVGEVIRAWEVSSYLYEDKEESIQKLKQKYFPPE